MKNRDLHIEELTESNWHKFEDLFGDNGACGGCWCMWWRLSSRDFGANKGEGNKRLFHEVVLKGGPAGLIIGDGKQAYGWCAVSPRNELSRMERSRVLKRVDDKEVWSLSCFFIRREWRKSGLSLQLIRAAIDYAGKHGASILEAYPKDTAGEPYPDAFAFTGLYPAFKKLGFQEVCRRSPSRPIMRYTIKTK